MNIAAIFDWDGVIVDSSDYHEESWERLADEEDRDLPPDHFKQGFGMRNHTIIPNILGWTDDADEIERLHDRKGELYREIVAEQGLSPLPGVESFLRKLHDADVPCAVGSSTERNNISFALQNMGMRDDFRAIVAGEDVKHGKPDPEVFLTAAQKLDVAPDRCVVFEDAHVGIEAGKAAGMKVVAVTTTHPRDTLQGADIIVDALTELSINQLTAHLQH